MLSTSFVKKGPARIISEIPIPIGGEYKDIPRTPVQAPRFARQSGVPSWLLLLIFAAGYYALMRWILPRFGVPT